MRQYTVLQSIVKKNIPELEALQPGKRKKMLRQILRENLVEILLKVKLPDPVDFRMQIIREHFLDLRRRKESKRGSRTFNYNLWRKLYEAKFNLKYSILENSQFQYEQLNDYTSLMPAHVDVSTNTEWDTPKITSASSILGNINQIASNFEISQELQAKMVVSHPYKEFVNCINYTCRSYEVEKLGFAEYLLREQKDIENPKWEKIMLDARFYERDMDIKIEKWEKLREIIDASIKELKLKTTSTEEIKKLEEKFYINLIF